VELTERLARLPASQISDFTTFRADTRTARR
jgi:hypothetical protein